MYAERRSMKIFFNVVMIGILLKIAWEDSRSRRIRDRLLILLLAAGLWNRFGYGEMQGILWESVAGILSVSVGMILICLWKPGCFGGGDIKLMAVSGFLLGWEKNLDAFFAGMLFAGIFCIWMLAAGKMDRKSKIALGPFLCAGLILKILCGCSG